MSRVFDAQDKASPKISVSTIKGILRLHMQEKRTKMNSISCELTAELLSSFVRETINRSASYSKTERESPHEHSVVEGQNTDVCVDDLKAILPQLLCDF